MLYDAVSGQLAASGESKSTTISDDFIPDRLKGIPEIAHKDATPSAASPIKVRPYLLKKFNEWKSKQFSSRGIEAYALDGNET